MAALASSKPLAVQLIAYSLETRLREKHDASKKSNQ